MGPLKLIASLALLVATATASTHYSENPAPAVPTSTPGNDISTVTVFSTTVVKLPATEPVPSIATSFFGATDSGTMAIVSSSAVSILPPSGTNLLPPPVLTSMTAVFPTSGLLNSTVVVVPGPGNATSSADSASHNGTVTVTKSMSRVSTTASATSSASASATTSAGPQNGGARVGGEWVGEWFVAGLVVVGGLFA